MDEYKKVYAINTEFFSSYSPNMIEYELENYIRGERKFELIVSEKKYKIKFSVIDEEEKKPSIEICARILKISNEKVCVEF
jgi:DNA-directed RNA polymerase specialized sigma subunit